jgi:2-polyprenyl-6-methoxyphenol hydroxylase-like FAD-dependent oxidoreductase
MTRSVDVLIVGGGPGGLAAGIVLGRAGLKVLLCERKTFPIDKVCGEGLMPTGVQHLRQLGAHVCQRFEFAGIRYLAPDGSVATADFREGPGWGIRRTALSEALLSAARHVDTLHIWQNVQVVPEAVAEGAVRVRANGEAVHTRLLIGADGLRSGVRRWAKLGPSRRRYWRWGARQHFNVKPWSDYVEVHWSGRDLEAYVTPVAQDQVGIAFLWRRDGYSDIRGGKALVPSLLAAFPVLQDRLQGAPATSEGQATGPLQQRTKQVVADGVLLLGDAAGYLDAITGEGLSLALAQALALRRTVVPALQQNGGLVPQQALAPYEATCRAILRPTTQVTEVVLLLSRFPALCNRVTRALQSDPLLFQQFLSANMGLRSPWRLPAVLRLAYGLLTP